MNADDSSPEPSRSPDAEGGDQPESSHREAEQQRQRAENDRLAAEAGRLDAEQRRDAAETSRDAAERARVAGEAARDAAIAAVRETSDSLAATLEHMKRVEELRRQRDRQDRTF